MTNRHDYDDELNGFVNFVHELASQIAERARSGASQKEQVLAAANDDLIGFCERYLAYYDSREFVSYLSISLNDERTLRAVVRMVAYCMIHQLEFDTGRAKTLRQDCAEFFGHAPEETAA
jgi:hypothetical protein